MVFTMKKFEQTIRVGDLVRCKSENHIFASGLDDGTGIVIQTEIYDPDNLSVCVQWNGDFLWYEEKDLEVISERLDR